MTSRPGPWWWAAACLLALASPPVRAEESPRRHRSWWIKHYGSLPSGDPFGARAHEVFERVLAVAERNDALDPRLVLVRESPSFAPLLSLALPDGSVLLSREAVQVCYENTRTDVGDSLLAFVLGHELAHLARNDFWHGFAAAALEKSGLPSDVKRELLQQLQEDAPATRKKELQADAHGLLYLSLAGYSSRALLKGGTAFLEKWLAARPAVDLVHPTPTERIAVLRSELEDVARQIDLFDFGVRLYQLGRHPEALLLLEQFKQRYPGREVLNAIGLCHYQLGIAALAECGEDRVVRFHLPVRLDPVTLARRVRMAPRPSDCPSVAAFERQLDAATSSFDRAAEMDRLYLPAQINLAAALIQRGEGAQALYVAEKLVKLAADDPDAINLKAVAFYVYGRQSQMGSPEPAIRLLEGVLSNDGSNVGALYNLAAITSEQNGTGAAQVLYRQFLALERRGPFARAARRNLPEGAGPLDERSALQDAPVAPRQPASCPVSLGRVSEATRRSLAKQGFTSSEFRIGTLRGAVHTAERLRVLELDSNIEIVEQVVAGTEGSPEDYGEPSATIDMARGSILLYRGFGLDVVDGRIQKWVYFSPPYTPED